MSIAPGVELTSHETAHNSRDNVTKHNWLGGPAIAGAKKAGVTLASMAYDIGTGTLLEEYSCTPE